MRIAINARFLLKGKLEGIGWFSYHICKRLVEQHPEHEFIFLFDRPYSEEFIFGKNVVPLNLFPPARHPILFLGWFEWSVRRALKKYKADVFFSPDGYCSLGTDVPTLLVCHDLAYLHFPEGMKWSHKLYLNEMMPRFLRKAGLVACVSDYTRRDVMAQYGVAEDKTRVVYNATDDSFRPLSLSEQMAVRQEFSEGQPYFLYVGAVHPRKNVARLLKAFDAFKAQTGAGHKLLLLGRLAWKTGEVQEALGELAHRDDVVLLGYQSDEVLRRLTASAFALTYISLFEGFGIPILEAMSCDTAVICSATSSMPEVAGDAALLIDPYSVDSIVAAMCRLHREPELRARLIEAGRQQRKLFDWDKSAAQVWDCLCALNKNA